jgi:hypothetical protein
LIRGGSHGYGSYSYKVFHRAYRRTKELHASDRSPILRSAPHQGHGGRTAAPQFLRRFVQVNEASDLPTAVLHRAFGVDRATAFFLCVFETDLVAAAAFARARAALLAAARRSADHGVY